MRWGLWITIDCLISARAALTVGTFSHCESRRVGASRRASPEASKVASPSQGSSLTARMKMSHESIQILGPPAVIPIVKCRASRAGKWQDSGIIVWTLNPEPRRTGNLPSSVQGSSTLSWPLLSAPASSLHGLWPTNPRSVSSARRGMTRHVFHPIPAIQPGGWRRSAPAIPSRVKRDTHAMQSL